MKKILALLLVLIISATSMISCGWLFGNDDGGNDIENGGGEGNGDGNIDNGGNQVIEEYDGDVNGKDNMDPNTWEGVIK